jgi:hypothetical protein
MPLGIYHILKQVVLIDVWSEGCVATFDQVGKVAIFGPIPSIPSYGIFAVDSPR